MGRERLSKSLRRGLVLATAVLGLTVGAAGTATANPSPNGPGLPGAPGTTCQEFTVTPGQSAGATGAPFNPAGISGGVYNPLSQYDIACYQQTVHSGG